ncbi:hypothetical protein VDGL01_11100 [Verticillium dahliae]
MSHTRRIIQCCLEAGVHHQEYIHLTFRAKQYGRSRRGAVLRVPQDPAPVIVTSRSNQRDEIAGRRAAYLACSARSVLAAAVAFVPHLRRGHATGEGGDRPRIPDDTSARRSPAEHRDVRVCA